MHKLVSQQGPWGGGGRANICAMAMGWGADGARLTDGSWGAAVAGSAEIVEFADTSDENVYLQLSVSSGIPFARAFFFFHRPALLVPTGTVSSLPSDRAPAVTQVTECISKRSVSHTEDGAGDIVCHTDCLAFYQAVSWIRDWYWRARTHETTVNNTNHQQMSANTGKHAHHLL